MQKAVRRGGGAAAAPPPPPGPGGELLWSVLYASAGDGAIIEVGVGDVVLLDVPLTPNYDSVTVYGTLKVSRTVSTVLRTKRLIVNGGTYFCGTRADPFPRGSVTHEWVPTGLRVNDLAVASPQPGGLRQDTRPESNRGCLVMNGGKWHWCSDVSGLTTVFKLGNTAAVGASSITSRVPVNLKAGDKLEVTTSKYYYEGLSDNTVDLLITGTEQRYPDVTRLPGWGQEVITVASNVVNSTTIPISQATTYDAGHFPTNTATLQHRHHGKIQYLVPPTRGGSTLEEVPGTNLSYTNHGILPNDVFGTVNGQQILGSRVLSAIAAGAASSIDNCSSVGLLTHPLKYGAPNDSDWNTYGYGAHLMVMGLTAECQMEGVERYRVGQAGFLGRYPDHQHMRSYTPYLSPTNKGGVYLGDVDGTKNFISKCSTSRSSNRGSTIHGTCGFVLEKNVYCYIDTHCIFLEDGSERRNVIDGNLVSGVRSLRFGQIPIKYHDQYTRHPFYGRQYPGEYSDAGASGIWYTSPDNYLRNNSVFGAFIGIWNTFACDQRFNPDDTNTDVYQFGCFGQSRNVEYAPMNHLNLQHFNNEAACCVSFNMRTQPRVINEDGGLGYGHYEAGRVLNLYDTTPNDFDKVNLWKCERWYNNEARAPHYVRWTCAGVKNSNTAIGQIRVSISGNAAPSHGAISAFDQALMVSTTLDDAYPNTLNNMMVSYNNGVNRINSIFVPTAPQYTYLESRYGLPLVTQSGQVMRLWDFYLYPVQRGFSLDTNTCVLGASPGWYGVRFPPLYMVANNYPDQGFSAAYKNLVGDIAVPWSQGNSGAMSLPADGLASMGQDGGWWVFDHPFLLHGTTGSVYAPSSPDAVNLNGKFLPDTYHFVGVQVERFDNIDVYYGDNSPINYTRYAADGVTQVGTWNTGAPHQNYPNMRHAAVEDKLVNGIIKADLPNAATPSKLLIALYAGYPNVAGQNFTLGIEFNPSTPVTSCVINGPGGPYTFTQVFNRADLLAAGGPTSRRYWRDTANSLLWLHLYYGDIPGYNDADPIMSFSKQNRLLKINVNGSTQ
jgi:hypothetical protein